MPLYHHLNGLRHVSRAIDSDDMLQLRNFLSAAPSETREFVYAVVLYHALQARDDAPVPVSGLVYGAVQNSHDGGSVTLDIDALPDALKHILYLMCAMGVSPNAVQRTTDTIVFC